MVDLIEKLKAVSYKANSQVDNINNGGCAVMAALVGKELEKLGVEVEGIAPWSNPSKARVNSGKSHKAHPMWWECNGVCFEHVALRFKFEGKMYTYDTDKLHKGRSRFGSYLQYSAGCKFGEGFNTKELKKLARCDDGYWNVAFNRKDIAKLRKIVKEEFSND